MAIVNPASKSVHFTIRVYGICVRNGAVLLSHENHRGVEMLKFPGGGLEYGEGTRDCLKREMQEEYQLAVAINAHFYTTDFFVKSVFHENTQVMSIYYLMDVLTENVPVNQLFVDDKCEQLLLWQKLSAIESSTLTFPIDRRVLDLMKEQFQ